MQAAVRSVLRSWQNFQRAQTSGTGHPAFSDTADVAARPAAERREQLDALHVLQVSAAEPYVAAQRDSTLARMLRGAASDCLSRFASACAFRSTE